MGTLPELPDLEPYLQISTDAGVAAERLVIVGNGMVCHRLCESLLALDRHRYDVTVFSEENCPAYDRVHLGDVLGGRVADSLLLAPRQWYRANAIDLRLGDPIVALDLDHRRVLTAHGERVAYDKLVMATGSFPVIPPIKIGDWDGVFLLRTLEDMQRVCAAAHTARRAVIIGGGLLGLETASALRGAGLELTILEQESRLMSRHLDVPGAAMLKQRLEELGIHVRVSASVVALARTAGQRVILRDGATLDADFVVIAAGVRPRDNLASWGLGTGRHGGYAINELLQTSDPRVYAIGECASWEDEPIGVVSPGYAMADCLAHTLVDQPARFQLPTPSVRLKISGLPVSVAGKSVPGAAPPVLAFGRDWVRSLQLKDGRVVRAVAVGPWEDWERLEDTIRRGCPVTPEQLHRFERGRSLFPDRPPVARLPAEMILCSCNSVTLGTVRAAIDSGCGSLSSLAARTHASTTCGACVPRLEELLLPAVRQSASRASLVIVGVLALMAVAGVASGRWLLALRGSDSLRFWDHLLRQPMQQQISGYVLLGLCLATLVFPLRRVLGVAPKRFASWRLVHAMVGTLAVVSVVAHTGLRLGANANWLLSIVFLVFAALGGLASFVRSSRSLHSLWLWPALALLGLHVVSVYYF